MHILVTFSVKIAEVGSMVFGEEIQLRFFVNKVTYLLNGQLKIKCAPMLLKKANRKYM